MPRQPATKRRTRSPAWKSLRTPIRNPRSAREATIKAAALAVELNQPKDAIRLFRKALGYPDIGDWKPAAQMGLMRVNFDSGNYEEVASTSKDSIKDLPGESYPEALLLIANAQRMLGHHQEARAAYDDLMQQFPASQAAKDAQFSRWRASTNWTTRTS